MPAAVRIGDPGSHGGAMSASTSGNLFADGGKRVCVDGDTYACAIHGPQPVWATSVHKSAGKAILRVGDVAACGAIITAGSPTFILNR